MTYILNMYIQSSENNKNTTFIISCAENGVKQGVSQ
jgi:hypothetical protein